MWRLQSTVFFAGPNRQIIQRALAKKKDKEFCNYTGPRGPQPQELARRPTPIAGVRLDLGLMVWTVKLVKACLWRL